MAAELIVPTNYTPTKPSTSRPITPIQMQKPDGTWSDNILYNFDTGASNPTDVPLPLLSAFGYGPNGVGTDSSKRKTVPVKIRIPGFNNNQEMGIPAMIQDKDHYDLFREQSNRYPLMRVYDLMPYLSIIFETKQTTFRSKDLGPPPEIADTQGIIMMPQSGQRTGTPTSAHYWTKGTMIGSKTYSNVWFNINTGDYRFIIPRSFCDKAGFKITSNNISGDGESFATGTFRWDETTPTKLTLSNIQVTARDDDEDFARGGIARCLMGGPHFLSKYKIVIWDLNMAFIPLSPITPPPPIPPTPTTEPADKGVARSGYDTDMSKWTAVNMRDYPTRGKIIDKNGDNVRVDFQSKENAQLWLDWKRSQPQQ